MGTRYIGNEEEELTQNIIGVKKKTLSDFREDKQEREEALHYTYAHDPSLRNKKPNEKSFCVQVK